MYRSNQKNILLVYPEFPNKTYWGMQYSLPFIGRKAFLPPLGLITIAAMSPPKHQFRLVDLNCRELSDDDLGWADMVCFSAMLPQQTPLFRAASRCKAAGKPVVFGGPFPTACPEVCRSHCDVLVLNEGELTWPAFLEDFEQGTWRDVYTHQKRPDLRETPIPRFDLLNMNDYGMIPVQFSRGCPFRCEFCDITVLFGRKQRTKTSSQFIAELQVLYDMGYRGGILVVDDNFIGNKRAVLNLLSDLQAWNETHRHPFLFFTQASLDLADDRILLKRMVDADFKGVFLGIESPSRESLKEAGKFQNIKDSLVDSVKTIQQAGLVVHGGFIIGFDHDGEDIFDRLIAFVTEAAIPNAFVELLFALPGTALHKRLEREGRLEPIDTENYLESRTNIVTILPRRKLLEGFRKVIETIYAPSEYFKRTLEHFSRLPPPDTRVARVRNLLRVGEKVIRIFSVNERQERASNLSLVGRLRTLRHFFRQLPWEFRKESLRFLWHFVRICPDRLPGALFFIIMGMHLYRYSFGDLIPDLDKGLEPIRREQKKKA